MADRDAELEQPDGQPSVAVQRIRPPRRTIVHQHPLGQAVLPKDRGQLGLHRAAAFVAAGPQPDCIARVVIDHGQRMAAPRARRKMPLVVHLPQLVRRRPLKPFKRFVAGACAAARDAAMTMQYRGNRAGARHRRMLQILQPAADLAATPGGMLRADRQRPGLPSPPRCAPASAAGAASGPPDPPCPSCPVARPQPIANRRADAKPPAQLATIHSFLLEQHHKLMPLRHDRLLRPRHPSPSPTGQRCR